MHKLLDHIAPRSETAPVMVVFGGSPIRRDEVLRHLAPLGDLGAYAALSEEEGYALILQHRARLRLVLIGGRYSPEQRERIKTFCDKHQIHTAFTEPGLDYPYENGRIQAEVKRLLGLYSAGP